MEVIGKLKVIGADQQIRSTFKKRECVVTTSEQYPQTIMIEFAQDKCEYLDGYKVGDEVKVSINLRGREWINPQGEAKYFNQIQGWRIERTATAAPQQPVPVSPVAPVQNQEEKDDLPF